MLGEISRRGLSKRVIWKGRADGLAFRAIEPHRPEIEERTRPFCVCPLAISSSILMAFDCRPSPVSQTLNFETITTTSDEACEGGSSNPPS
jgi:hypothetical protein